MYLKGAQKIAQTSLKLKEYLVREQFKVGIAESDPFVEYLL